MGERVRDTGTGLPPEQRSASLLARIWELSSSHGGFLGVESGPRGTSVIFTLQLHLPEASDGEDLPTVLVCAPDAATRHELGAMLRDLLADMEGFADDLMGRIALEFQDPGRGA